MDNQASPAQNCDMKGALLAGAPAVLMILVAGPYRSGTSDDPRLIAANVAAMMDAALRLFRAGHLPVLGEWYACRRYSRRHW